MNMILATVLFVWSAAVVSAADAEAPSFGSSRQCATAAVSIVDAGSGVARIDVVRIENATVLFTEYAEGARSALVQFAIEDRGLPASISVEAADSAGNTAKYDYAIPPIVVSMRREPIMPTLQPRRYHRDSVTVYNGGPYAVELVVEAREAGGQAAIPPAHAFLVLAAGDSAVVPVIIEGLYPGRNYAYVGVSEPGCGAFVEEKIEWDTYGTVFGEALCGTLVVASFGERSAVEAVWDIYGRSVWGAGSPLARVLEHHAGAMLIVALRTHDGELVRVITVAQ
jgi:hypothetical protein